jgi:hypothetical protein
MDAARRLAELCEALPDAVAERSGRQATFRVRGRPFAYLLDDHHGDGILAVAFRPPLGDPGALALDAPERVYSPAYIGPRGWVALRLDAGPNDWGEIAGLVAGSYVQVAPARLAAQLDPPGRP